MALAWRLDYLAFTTSSLHRGYILLDIIGPFHLHTHSTCFSNGVKHVDLTLASASSDKTASTSLSTLFPMHRHRACNQCQSCRGLHLIQTSHAEQYRHLPASKSFRQSLLGLDRLLVLRVVSRCTAKIHQSFTKHLTCNSYRRCRCCLTTSHRQRSWNHPLAHYRLPHRS